MSLDSAIRETLLELVRTDPDNRAAVAEIVAEAAAVPEYLSTRAAAEMAGVAAGTIRRWVREGKLTRYTAGADLRVKRDELEALLAAGGRQRAESPEELADRLFG